MSFILGFDPSLDGFGYAVLDVRTKKVKLVEKGVVRGRNSTWGDTPHSVKLSLIQAKVKELRAKYNPVYPQVFSEMGFTMGRQNKSNHGVFKARGAMESELVGLELVEFSPITVKKIITGDRFADKEKVQQYVSQLFNLNEEWGNDNESDAVAVAYVGYKKFVLEDGT